MEYESLIKLSYQDENKFENTYSKRIADESTTKLDFFIGKYQAFYITTPEILSLVTKIMEIDKTLEFLIYPLPRAAISQLSTQYLIEEIKQTNDMENVHSTRKEISDTMEKIYDNKSDGRFNGLISKYIKLKTHEHIPLETCQDIRNLYDEIVLPEVLEDDPTNAPDGLIFRKAMASVYTATGKEIHKGVFPESKIIDCTTKALNILQNDNINDLIAMALFHYFFEYIHPFYDGNGRMGRFISSYLISEKFNHLVAYKLSYTIKKNTSKYYDMFEDTNNERNRGDLTPFIKQFLEFILDSENNVRNATVLSREKLEFYNDKLDLSDYSKNEKEVLFVLIQSALFGVNKISLKEIDAATSISTSTIRKILTSTSLKDTLSTELDGNKKIYSVDLDKLFDCI